MKKISYFYDNRGSIKVYLGKSDFEVLIRSLDFYKYLVVNFYDLKLDSSKKEELLENIDFTAQMIYSIYFDNFQKGVLTSSNLCDIL